MPRRALISVYDKEGVDAFARVLHELGWELAPHGKHVWAIRYAKRLKRR